uniref:SPARC/Testican calcium-binding domain-containing protein n=1 Tax=Timema cristinae TaxID=61476 RepID=A0A7R9D0J1_TIMCR|nr:unnamed protein product [Timema cristinae]
MVDKTLFGSSSVSRHELFPIRAPLMALEHCIAPFLDSCDVNDDHRITLKEWGKCLQLDENLYQTSEEMRVLSTEMYLCVLPNYPLTPSSELNKENGC